MHALSQFPLPWQLGSIGHTYTYDVAGIEYVPALIEQAQRRAAAEGRDVDFRIGDAQALPYADASFDAVLSVYGVQFAPDQEKAASKLLRVCRLFAP